MQRHCNNDVTILWFYAGCGVIGREGYLEESRTWCSSGRSEVESVCLYRIL